MNTPKKNTNTLASLGRPRSQQARNAIFSAFIEKMHQNGYESLSIDRVAKRAGVSRATIYRWYDNKASIALDIATGIAKNTARQHLTGCFDKDMTCFLQTTFIAAEDLGQLFTALMAQAQADKAFAQKVWDQFSSVRRKLLGEILTSGHRQPDNRQDAIEFLMDMVFGAIWYRLMSRHAPLDQRFLDDVLAATRKLAA